MGFFSWYAQDTGRSISNQYSTQPTFPVTMMDNEGNEWLETNYEGYGEFGGKDFYELLAEMNGLGSDRQLGIDLAFSGKPYISPNLVEHPTKWLYTTSEPDRCPDQGYFYYDEDEGYDYESDY